VQEGSGTFGSFVGSKRDAGAPSCPLCGAQFTTTFRRHHCRHCGTLCCDDCSKQRLRLPRQPTWGKVRVCDPCAGAIGQSHTTGFEEDLAVNSEIIDQLRTALSLSYAESEASKRVLLELESEASKNPKLLEQYAEDPESDSHSFVNLQKGIQERWTSLLSSLDQQARLQVELQERRGQLAQRREEADGRHRELLEHRAAVDAELAEMARTEAQRDELARNKVTLEAAVVAARRRVNELELERREHEERRAQREAQWNVGRVEMRQAGQGAPGSVPQAFTITTGARDPLQPSRSRLEGCRRSRTEGCRRSCSLM